MTSATLRIGIAKSVFSFTMLMLMAQLFCDKKLRRDAVLGFLGKLLSCLIGV